MEVEINKESLKKMGIEPELGKSLPTQKYIVRVNQDTKFISRKFAELTIGDMLIIEYHMPTSENTLDATNISYVPSMPTLDKHLEK